MFIGIKVFFKFFFLSGLLPKDSTAQKPFYQFFKGFFKNHLIYFGETSKFRVRWNKRFEIHSGAFNSF